MIDWGFRLVLIWHAVLILLLLVHSVRTRQLMRRIVAFEALSVVFVSALVVLGLLRQEAHYFDIALLTAMLAFVQTIAVVRFVEHAEDLR